MGMPSPLVLSNNDSNNITTNIHKKKQKASIIKLSRVGLLLMILVLVGSWTTLVALASSSSHVLLSSSASNNVQQQKQQGGQTSKAKRRILFVHIGKTGGETLKAQLQVSCKTRKNPNIRSECQERFQNAAAAAASVSSNVQGGSTPSSTTTTTAAATAVSTTTTTTYTSLVSEHTVGYFHITTLYPRNAIPLATDYLFTLRNPIHRVISWYAYNHPKSCDRVRDDLSPSCQLQEHKRGSTWGQAFFQCFDTMNDFAMASTSVAMTSNHSSTVRNDLSSSGSSHRDGTTGLDCLTLARRAMSGDAPEKELNHLLWNYRYYYDKTIGVSKQKQILVIRTEFLQQDFVKLNDFLAGVDDGETTAAVTERNSDSGGGTKRSTPNMVWMEANPKHNVEQHPVKTGVIDKDITPLGLFHLCCALQDELDIYSFLIRAAVNLAPKAKQESLQTLTAQCGEEGTRRHKCAKIV